MKVDIHCHVFHDLDSYKILTTQFKEFIGYGFYERILDITKKRDSIDTNNIIEKTIFHVKNAGIDKVVLLPLSKNENQIVKEWQKFAPEIFIPFFNPPEKPIGNFTIKEIIDNAILEDNYKGFKIMLPFREKYLNDKILQPVLEAAQQYDLITLMHSGHAPPGTRKNVLTYSNPIVIDEIINSFPKVKLVLAHMGWPWVDNALALAVQYPNIYLDISNLTYMMPYRLKEFLLRAKDIIGVDKLLFGSDTFVPEMIEMTIHYFNNFDFLTKQEINKILGLNAKKLLNL
jgi:predicted TIM-barrel fold metal-dependent hydrolase